VLGCCVSLYAVLGCCSLPGLKMNKRRGHFQHEAAEEATTKTHRERKTRNDAWEKDDGA